MLIVKKCIRCRNRFETDKFHPYTKLCSYECRWRHKHERNFVPMYRTCKVCEAEFRPRGNQKTCSKKCHQINHNNNSRRWNKENWNSGYKEYMDQYHKKAWIEFKRRYKIKDKCLIRQKVLIEVIKRIFPTTELIEEAKFDWLRGKTGKLFRVDAYIPEFNVIVEYDGEQHFKPIRWTNNQTQDPILNLKRQKERDAIKNKLIPKNGLILVRFSHKEPVQKEEYVKNKLMASINDKQ